MAHGLGRVDKDWRIHVRNKPSLELYGLGQDVKRHPERRGRSHPQTARTRFFFLQDEGGARRNSCRFPESDPGEGSRCCIADCPGGRIIAVRHQRWMNGGTGSDLRGYHRERDGAAERMKEQHRLSPQRWKTWRMGYAGSMTTCADRSIRRYIEMFGMSPDVVQPGTTIRARCLAKASRSATTVMMGRHAADTLENMSSAQSGDLILHRHLATGPASSSQARSRCGRAALVGDTMRTSQRTRHRGEEQSRTWRA